MTELDTSGNGQATTVRSAVTEVMVRDRDTIAMGGLLRDKETVSVNKVPLLGDIPVLGWLFKSKSRKIDNSKNSTVGMFSNQFGCGKHILVFRLHHLSSYMGHSGPRSVAGCETCVAQFAIFDEHMKK